MRIFKNTKRFCRGSAKLRVFALAGLLGAGGTGWWYVSGITEDTPEEAAERQAAEDKEFRSQVLKEMQPVVEALIDYKVEHGDFPTTEEGLNKLLDGGELEEKALKDRFGNPYNYKGPTAEDANISLSSSGKDGKVGNDDDISADKLLPKSAESES